MAYLTGTTKKYLKMFEGIEEKERYRIRTHTGEDVVMTGKELRIYIAAHSRFIQIEQPVTENVIVEIENKN